SQENPMRIISEPKSFFDQNSDESKTILKRLYQVAVRAFTVPESDEFFADVESHVKEADMLGMVSNGGNICGFICIDTNKSDDILFVSGIAVDSSLTACRGVGPAMISDMVRHTNRRTLALTTQSLRMYAAAKRLCSTIYPHPIIPIPDELGSVAKSLMWQ